MTAQLLAYPSRPTPARRLRTGTPCVEGRIDEPAVKPIGIPILALAIAACGAVVPTASPGRRGVDPTPLAVDPTPPTSAHRRSRQAPPDRYRRSVRRPHRHPAAAPASIPRRCPRTGDAHARVRRAQSFSRPTRALAYSLPGRRRRPPRRGGRVTPVLPTLPPTLTAVATAHRVHRAPAPFEVSRGDLAATSTSFATRRLAELTGLRRLQLRPRRRRGQPDGRCCGLRADRDPPLDAARPVDFYQSFAAPVSGREHRTPRSTASPPCSIGTTGRRAGPGLLLEERDSARRQRSGFPRRRADQARRERRAALT